MHSGAVKKTSDHGEEESYMAKRIFISFAIEDEKYRNFLVGQAKNEKSPFEFVDMSVKEPWSKDWKEKCLSKIRGCDGMIVLVSKNTKGASGARYEIQCAADEKIPLMAMYVDAERDFSLPPELDGKRINVWSWDNLKAFIDRL